MNNCKNADAEYQRYEQQYQFDLILLISRQDLAAKVSSASCGWTSCAGGKGALPVAFLVLSRRVGQNVMVGYLRLQA